jgi:hypothetical protein
VLSRDFLFLLGQPAEIGGQIGEKSRLRSKPLNERNGLITGTILDLQCLVTRSCRAMLPA